MPKKAAPHPQPAVVSTLPDRDDGDRLTARQRAILEAIRDSVERRGYPPSIREICEAAGLASTSSVAHQLRALERKGYFRRDPNRPRAVDVRLAESARRERPGERHWRRRAEPGVRPGRRAHRCRRPHPGRATDRGRVSAATARWSARARCSCFASRVIR